MDLVSVCGKITAVDIKTNECNIQTEDGLIKSFYYFSAYESAICFSLAYRKEVRVALNNFEGSDKPWICDVFHTPFSLTALEECVSIAK